MREPRNSKIWGSGGVQRQRYAAITARECLTALSMIKIPQMHKKCGELAPGDRAGCCHRGEATCWQTEGAKELALKTIQGGLTALFYAVTRSFHASEYWMFPSQYFQVIRS